MMKFLQHFLPLPLSLRARFLFATTVVVMVLSLAYGVVALVGYNISFDKTTFRLLRGESNLLYTLATYENGQINVVLPANFHLKTPTMALIYDDKGNLMWAQRDLPHIVQQIKKEWLAHNGFHDLEENFATSNALLANDEQLQHQLKDFYNGDYSYDVSHSVAVNKYPAMGKMPALTIVVIDTIPWELKRTYTVWSMFISVFLANLLLVIPLLWVAARWSLRPIEALAQEVRELEKHDRDSLNPETTRELTSLVSNLNRLLRTERDRYDKYRTTLTDLTHSLKTPLAVLQSTLRSLRTHKLDIETTEPVMLEQISRISQQIGYYLHRANMRGDSPFISHELHPVAPLLDSLCSALNKVYQRKGVAITLDISPEITFMGEKNDFMEVMGNVLDNACKYCLEFVEISGQQRDDTLHLIVEDDGPGIPESKRSLVFDRGQRADTLRPGQGVGLSVAREIVEQYDGKIQTATSELGGAYIEVIFARQRPERAED